jgi:hypothetical protein
LTGFIVGAFIRSTMDVDDEAELIIDGLEDTKARCR